MPYCHKCGTEVHEETAFCPKCGAPLIVSPAAYISERAEKREKGDKEKREKSEKTEKYEKKEFGFVSALIGGLILIFLGLAGYLTITGFVGREFFTSIFLVIIGIMIIFGVILASRRHPKP